MNARIKLFFAAAILAAFAAKAHAQNMSAAESINFRNMTLNLLEKNNYEALQREEIAKQRAARLAPATYDLNADGVLDAKEYGAWEKQVRLEASLVPALVRLLDKNGDKQIDDAEWAQGRSKLIK